MTSQNKLEIIVIIDEVSYYMDTYDNVPVPLNYQIADISEIDKRRSSYSLSITVPETSHNRFIFNSVSDLSVDLTTFNPNLKSPTTILFDSIPVFSGNLQLIDVEVDIDTGETKYNCVVYSENDDFFKTVGDFTIAGPQTNLDFSTYSHTYSIINITQSWTADWSNGYFYPLIDTTGEWQMNLINETTPIIVTNSNGVIVGTTFSKLHVKDFYPATYVKVIWDNIFNTAGYSYTSDFLNSPAFENLLFPFSGKIINQELDFINSLIFRVAETATQSISRNWTPFTAPNMFGAGNFIFNVLTFDNENPPNGDPNGLWDPGQYYYTNLSIVPYKQRFGLSFRFYATFQFELVNQPTQYWGIFGVRSGDPATGFTTTNPNWSLTPTKAQVFSYARIPFVGGYTYYAVNTNNNGNSGFAYTGGYDVDGIFNEASGYTEYLDSSLVTSNNPGQGLYYNPLSTGEQVRFYMFKYTSRITTSVFGGQFGTSSLISQNSYVFNNVDTQIIPDQPIDYNTVLPINIKQKDFLTSIIKMFNLYIEPDKTYPKTLNIEPRNDYYASGAFKDWSEKLDISQPIMEQILAETQNISTLFTYKLDSDFYNTDYTGRLKENYGQVRYIIDNDFIDGEKKIENIFSPTPLSILTDSEAIVLPVIFKLNNGKKQKADSFNYRILYKTESGIVPLGVKDYWNFEGSTYSYYPYIGHFNDPYVPTSDLNWGQSYLYYSNVPTNNNLLNVYWKQTMDELSDINSRIITVQLYLTPEDINQFKFNDNIYLVVNGVGGYYKVNKISNYDPTQTRTTTVELLKTINLTVPLLEATTNPDTTNIVLPGIVGTPRSLTGVWTHETGNIVSSNGTIITGIYNTVNGQWTYTGGIGNIINSNASMLIGYFNVMNFGQNQFMLGNYNQSNSNSRIFIVGDYNYSDYNTDSYTGSSGGSSSGFINDVTIFGDYNYARGSNTYIVGTGSTAHTGAYIFGNNNYGSTGSYIFGNNVYLTQSDIMFINVPVEFGPSSSISATAISGPPNTMAYFDPTGNLSGIFVVDDSLSSLAEGVGTTASGPQSHAEGTINEASGQSAHAEGFGSLASGPISHAEGNNTLASGTFSHAQNNNTIASGDASHAEGSVTRASALNAHSEGADTLASGINSHAEGSLTIASGFASHAEGEATTSFGYSSHAEGNNNTATGTSSHTEGTATQAIGSNSHAEGDSTIASGEVSHSEGSQCVASGEGSHAEGLTTTAEGQASHSQGLGSSASGTYSFAFGNFSKASAELAVAGGFASKSDHFNEWSRGSVPVSGNGSAQNGILSYSHALLPNNATTEIFLDAASQRFNMVDTDIYLFQLSAIVRSNGGASDFAFVSPTSSLVITNNAGTMELYTPSGVNTGGSFTFSCLFKSTGTYVGTSIILTTDNANQSMDVSVLIPVGAPSATAVQVRLEYDKISLAA